MLKGKVALVTGSTSGIGLAIARALAKEGADVMLNGFGEAQAIEKTCTGLEAEFGVKVGWSGADLSQPAAVTGLVEYTVRRLGGVDILCNNAGIQHTAPIERFPPEKWDAIIGVNLSSAFHATRVAVPHMRKTGPHRQHRVGARARGLGREIGLRGSEARPRRPHQGGGARDGGQRHHLQRVLPRLRADRPHPPADRGARAESGRRFRGGRDLLAEKPLSKQLVTVDQLVVYIVFLCSDAAAQIAGTAPPLDGGWTAQ